MGIVVAVASPLLAFAGSFLGVWLTRKTAKELDRWRKREETFRLLRWAVELTASSDPGLQSSGVVVLSELLDSDLLDKDDQALVGAVAAHVFDEGS